LKDENLRNDMLLTNKLTLHNSSRWAEWRKAPRRRSAGFLQALPLVYGGSTNASPPLDAMGLLDLIGIKKPANRSAGFDYPTI